MKSLPFILGISTLIVACATEPVRPSDDDDDSGSGGQGGFDNPTAAGGASTTATSGTTATTTATTTSGTTTSPTVTTTSVATTSSGQMGCLNDPDCPNCFCNQDPTGCNDYINAVITHIYCGQSCGGSCSAFCSSQDPNQIDVTCEGCVMNNVSQSDIDAFSAQCGSSPNCSNFVNQISMCP